MPTAIRARAGVVAAVLLYLVVGMLYVTAVPPWEAPDEPWHLAYAEALAAGRLPTPADTYEAHQPPLYYGWAALALRVANFCAVPRAIDNPYFPFAAAAYAHPPGEVALPILRLVRTFSGFMGVLVVALAWAAARAAAPGDARRGMLVALTAALWPQFDFISHSVSNDVLAAVCGASVIYGTMCLVRRPGIAIRSGLVVAAGLAAGAATKLNVLALIPAVVLGAMLAVWRSENRLRLAVELAALGGGAAALAATALRALSPLAPGMLATEGLTRALQVQTGSLQPRVLAEQSASLILSFWARFGWLNVDLPTAVTGIALAVGLMGLAGVIVTWRRRPVIERWALAVAAVASLSALLAAVKNLLVDPQPQGRFLFPALAAAAFLLASGWLALSPRRREGWLIGGLIAGLLAVNLLATTRWLPSAYETSRQPAPTIDLRRVGGPARSAMELTADDEAVHLPLHVTRPGLYRVLVSVGRSRGAGDLVMALRMADGRVVTSDRWPLDGLPLDRWVGLDVGRLADNRGADYTLELRVTGPGRALLWTTGEAQRRGGEANTKGLVRDELALMTLVAAPPSVPPPRSIPLPCRP
jgi:hypothetical protein